MILAGLVNTGGGAQTASLINSIFTSNGRKTSIVDSDNLQELHAETVEKYVSELGKNGTDILILKLNMENMNQRLFDHLSLDMIIFGESAVQDGGGGVNSLVSRLDRLFTLLSEKGVAIVSENDADLMKLLTERGIMVISYGFSPKACITTSSVGDVVFRKGILCSIQRPISATDGRLVHPQECLVNLESPDMDVYDALAAVTLAIVNGVDPSELSH